MAKKRAKRGIKQTSNNMKTYISGKITGLTLEDAEALFQQAEDHILELKYEPVNPMKLVPYNPDLTWKDYMIADIEALMRCDACFMLKNWTESKGAQLEHTIAQSLGLHIEYLHI